MAKTSLTASVYFTVMIDGFNLGDWASCEGLGFKVNTDSREEGGNQAFVHKLARGIDYNNVKLTRPVMSDSGKISSWFANLATNHKRTTAQITLWSTDQKKPIASWQLDGVIPVSWSGPSMSVDSPKAATETIEIAHHGFLGGSTAAAIITA